MKDNNMLNLLLLHSCHNIAVMQKLDDSARANNDKKKSREKEMLRW